MLKPLFFALTIAAGVASAAGPYTPAQINSAIKQAGGPEKFLAAISTNAAKMSGQMLDSETQLTAAATHEKTIVNYMRLVNYEKKDIENLSALRQKVAKTNSPSVCTAPVSSILINEYDAEFKYMVYSKSGEYLYDYSFNKKTCSSSYAW